MSTQHHLMGSINQFSQESMYHQSRQYPSPHHSPSLDMGKPVVNHGDRWGSGSPTQAYQMSSATPDSWNGYGKQQSQQQRLPPTPPMHTHLGDYPTFPSPTPTHHYGSLEADYQEHGLSMASVQHTPLSPPVSEGFLSPDLNNQDPHQTWLNPYGVKSEATNIPLLDSSPLLGINTYNSGNITVMQQAQPIPGEKRRNVDGLFPDVSSSQAQRKKRRLTEPGEANYHCQTCGKYFSRVWNYNAHRETHDPRRPKPHMCTEPNCKKAFVRRTDLTRHVQCVHAKHKKFKCNLCNNRFARKDTLRRHEDDGCPKRVDIQSRNNKSSSPITWSSWALRCPPPPEYFTFASPKQQHQQQPMFDSTTSASFLPPLSVALNGSQQHGSMLMP